MKQKEIKLSKKEACMIIIELIQLVLSCAITTPPTGNIAVLQKEDTYLIAKTPPTL